MKAMTHALCVIAGLAGPILFEGWTTSDSGPRSKAHYAAVVSASQTPRDRAIAFGIKAFDNGQPAQAVRDYFSADAIDHAAPGLVGAENIAAKAGELDWLKPGSPRKQVQVAGDRNLAFVRYSVGNQDRIEIYKIKAGKIIEHWTVAGAAAASTSVG